MNHFTCYERQNKPSNVKPLGTTFLICLLLFAMGKVHGQSYTWSNVDVQGLGWVTGIVAHPTANPSLFYIRTDNGGVFRWEASQNQYIPISDGLGRFARGHYTVESVAIDPSDANLVYMATGDHDASGKIFRSANRGASWTQMGLSGVYVGGNDGNRRAGEKLVVDPNRGGTTTGILYFGSRKNGLWKSVNSGSSWSKVAGGFPNAPATDGAGISFVIFDPASGVNASGATNTIYVGVWQSGIYRSTDAGTSWQFIGGPTNAVRASVAPNPDRRLYVSCTNDSWASQGSIQRYTGSAWQNVTPDNSNVNYSGISIDPTNPARGVALSNFCANCMGLYVSNNLNTANPTWTNVQEDWGTPGIDRPEWYQSGYEALGTSLVIDPNAPQRVFFTSGWGVWKADNVNQPPVKIQTVMKNVEQLVGFDMKSPPTGDALLFSSCADAAGFRHTSLTSPPARMFNTTMAQSKSSDFCYQNPNVVAWVGVNQYPEETRTGLSQNNGATFTPFPSLPNGGHVNRGIISISSTAATAGNMVWAPENTGIYYTTNGGQSWQSSSITYASNTVKNYWCPSQSLTADKVTGNTFYFMDNGGFFRSTNGGATFVQQASGLPITGEWNMVYVRSAPGMAGFVVVTVDGQNKFWRTTNGGANLTQVPLPQSADFVTSMGFGIPLSGQTPSVSTPPAAYAYGIIGGKEGVFRSDNITAPVPTWVQLTPDGLLLGNANGVSGDMRVPGRVFVARNGRGFAMGTMTAAPPAANQPPSVALTAPSANATFTAPATINLSASASDAGGSVTKVEFYQGTTKLGEDTSSPYAFSWANVPAGNYSLTARATDNSGATTTSTAVAVSVTAAPPASSGADLIGPDCIVQYDIKLFELNARHLTNATTIGWWSNGPTQNITPVAGQNWKAMIDFGQWFTTGDVCIGVNYSVAPWYRTFCKTITRCSVGARMAAETDFEEKTLQIYPNPVRSDLMTGLTTRKGERITMEFITELGQVIAVYAHVATKDGFNQFVQSVRTLPSGWYIIRIQGEQRMIGSQKVLVMP